MIRYPTETGWLIVYQPAHALLSGQLAAHWAGDDQFPRPASWSELLVAVSQHDVGWVAWEQAAQIDEEGAPQNFTDLRVADHLAIWRRGVRYAGHQSSLLGVLVSRHATALYGHRREESPQIATFLDEQRRLQADLLKQLPYDQPYVDEAYQLIRLMDWLSLALCMGRAEEGDVELGAGPGGVALTLVPLDPTRITVRPWPFDVSRIEARVAAQRLTRRTFVDDAELQVALGAAETVYRRWMVERV